MATTPNDLVVVLTGGSGNINPNDSLGGEPSSQPIIGVLNNLFSNISENNALNGYVDHRCIYIFNNSSSSSMYDFKVYIYSEISGGSSVELGLKRQKETQRITIAGTVASGSFDVTYQGETKTVSFSGDPATWAGNLQTALNNISTLENVVVTAGGSFSNRVFNISFNDDNDYRYHDLLEVNITNLTGATSSGVSRITAGEPINSIPPLLEEATTEPDGVEFSYPTASSPLIVGTLRPEEGFPLWIRRTTEEETTAIENDGFSLRFSFTPVEE